MCRFAWKLIALILLFVLLPVSSLQATMEYVPAGQVVEGPLLMSGNNIRVDGKVDGDLYATGTDVFISGEVTGDIIAAGRNISISGPFRATCAWLPRIYGSMGAKFSYPVLPGS